MHYHNIILFFEPALVLVDLAFERFDREIDRLLERIATDKSTRLSCSKAASM